MRKTLVVFIALLMILSLVPATVMAEDVKYPLWVGDVQVSSDVYSGEGWLFEGDASGGTLKLNNANINSSTTIAPGFENTANIRIDEGAAFSLQIDVYGNNTLSASGNGYGIYVNSEVASLKITGPGKLKVSGAGWGIEITSGYPFWIDETTISVEANSNGIYANDIKINKSDVTVVSGGGGIACGSLSITDSDVSSRGNGGAGIYCAKEDWIAGDGLLEVSGSSYVDAVGSTDDAYVVNGAIYCKKIKLEEGVEVLGPSGVGIELDQDTDYYRAYMDDGTLSAEVTIGSGYPLWVGKVHVSKDEKSGEGWSFEGNASGGTLTLTDAAITDSTPVTEDSSGTANIRVDMGASFDLKIELVGENTLSGADYGIYVNSSGGDDPVESSLVITGPGSLKIKDQASYGIHAYTSDGFVIEETEVEATGGVAGIMTGSVTVSDSTVTASGSSFGIRSDEKIEVNDSHVHAKATVGGTGIYCKGSGLKVNGDSCVKAAGTETVESVTIAVPGAMYCNDREFGENIGVLEPEGVSIERESENGPYRAYKEDGSLATEVIIGRAYPLWVGEGQVTTGNMKDLTVIGGVTAAEGGKVSFRVEKDSETGDKKNILTLDNATIDGLHNSNGMNKSITFEKMDLTIEVSGESRVGSENNGDGIQSNSYGIQSNGTLTFEGDGSVSISGSSTGINAYGNDVIINGGDVSAIGKVYGLYAVCKTTYDIDNGEYIDHGGFVTVNAGSLNAVSTDTVNSCEAINVRKLTVNGGKLTAETRNEKLVIYESEISAILSRDVPALGEGIYIISPQNGEFMQFKVYGRDQYLITDGENRVGKAVIGPAGKIVFQNYDGAVLQSSTVGIGEIPVYEGDEPEKDPDAQYTYKFAGWVPEPVAVTGDATYTAKYDSFLREYTVTFENYDKTVLQSGKVKYGDTPVYTGKEPVKPEDEKYTYSFDGWTPSVVKVTAEAKYTAVFKAIEKDPVYTVIEGADGSWTKGSGEGFSITVKRSFDDDECFSHFTGVSVDGKALEKSAYTAVKGSTVVTLGTDALEQLSEGGHTVTVEFDDGEAETEITVKPEEKKDDVPDTGIEDHMVLFTVISFICAVSAGAVLTLRKRTEE